jgi:hypothetical protein
MIGVIFVATVRRGFGGEFAAVGMCNHDGG